MLTFPERAPVHLYLPLLTLHPSIIPLTLGFLFTSLDSGPHMVLWMVQSPVIWYPLCLDMVAVVLYEKVWGDCWAFDVRCCL